MSVPNHLVVRIVLKGNLTICEVFEVEEFNANNKYFIKQSPRGHF